MSETQQAAKAAKTTPSQEDEKPNPLMLSEENLSWYTYGMTKETNKQKRLRGWKIVANALSEPIPGEIITNYTTEGNVIIDRTHHMRTVKSRKKGNNVLFEWRSKFEGEDKMFFEFFVEACKLCSFTVPTRKALKGVLSKIDGMSSWASDQETAESTTSKDPTSTIIPHFRIIVPPFDNTISEAEREGDDQEWYAPWEDFFNKNTMPFSLDLVLQGDHPKVHLATGLQKAAMPALAAPPRYQFDDEALRDILTSTKDGEAADRCLGQMMKAILVSILIANTSVDEEDKSKRDKLAVYVLSQKEGERVLRLCYDKRHLSS